MSTTSGQIGRLLLLFHCINCIFIVVIDAYPVFGFGCINPGMCSGPSNQAAVHGTQVTFSCTVKHPGPPGGFPAVDWWFYPYKGGPGIKMTNGFTILPPTPPRYTVGSSTPIPPNLGNFITYTLTDNNVQWDWDAGTYRCVDTVSGNEFYSADLVTLNSQPQCSSSMPAAGEQEFGTIRDYCQVLWDGFVAPVSNWHNAGVGTLSGPITNLGTVNTNIDNVAWLLEKNLDVTALQSNHNNGDGTANYQCTTNYNAVPWGTAGIGNHAGNVPSYSFTCSAPTVKTLWCPRSIPITPIIYEYTPPNTLTCSVSCNPPCTYTWTNVHTGAVTNGNTMPITAAMAGPNIYNYMCQACTTVNGAHVCCDTNHEQFVVNPKYVAPPPINILPVWIALGTGLAAALLAGITAFACQRMGACGPLPKPPPPPVPPPPPPPPQQPIIRRIKVEGPPQQPQQPQVTVIRASEPAQPPQKPGASNVLGTIFMTNHK